MSAPKSLAEAQAQCRAAGVDTRVSGKGMSACLDLLAPFCPNGVDSNGPGGIPQCAQAAPDARKAAALLAEAEAKQAALRSSGAWLWVGAAGLAAVALYFVSRA
ncbi:MAG: hypothetical protein JWL95_3265 [Gemmatimonadetes bacterium]|nr:hypothetical protein [Gemmatimonadota bacterium]